MGTYPQSLGPHVTHDDVVYYIEKELEAIKDIPAAPTTDGTYMLTCTVDDGEVEYSWESLAD